MGGLTLAFSFPAAAQSPVPSPVAAIADDYLMQYFAAYPQVGTFYGIATADNAGLSDNSAVGEQRWRATQLALLKRLKAVNQRGLSAVDAGTYALLDERLEGSLGWAVCHQERWDVSQMSGWQVGLSGLADVQPVGTAQNRANTLARWGKIPRYIQRYLGKGRQTSNSGMALRLIGPPIRREV